MMANEKPREGPMNWSADELARDPECNSERQVRQASMDRR